MLALVGAEQQIRRAVIVFDSVAVVGKFRRDKIPPEGLLEDKGSAFDVAAVNCCPRVARRSDVDVASW